MEDMTDKAIDWIGQQKALMPDKPFFVYFAPGATHAPHHVPKEWADKYKGKFDQGWDKLREETFARQKKLGVIPAGLPAHRAPQGDPGVGRHAGGAEAGAAPRRWRCTPGFLEYTDHHVGRLLDALKKLDILDDTLVYYIIGDNGASAEGTLNGTFNEMINFNGAAALETPEFLDGAARQAGRAGVLQPLRRGLGARDGHALPVDQAGRVALGRHAQRHDRALAEGDQGARARCARSSTTSSTSRRRSSKRRACPQPISVNGVQQKPIEGVSMLYSFNDAKAAERHETQYFEMFGNRGIYHKGWTAVTRHKTPWLLIGEKTPAFDDDVWELYDTNKDWSQANDLAKQMPEKLHELQRLWLIEATRYNVLPLDDRRRRATEPGHSPAGRC